LEIDSSGNVGIWTRSPLDRLSLFDGAGTAFGLYSSFTDASNYSRLRIFYDSANTRYLLVPQAAGTGVLRPVDLGEAGNPLRNVVAQTVRAETAFNAAGTNGISATLTVRDAGNTADCNIVITGGIVTGSTC
jgi:hypothetical protein